MMRLVCIYILIFIALYIPSYAQSKITISTPEVFSSGKSLMIDNHCLAFFKNRTETLIDQDSVTLLKQKIIQCIKCDSLIRYVDISLVCCEEGTGNWMMYIGIDTTSPQKFTTQYISKQKLPVLFHTLYDSLLSQIQFAVQSGNAQEDLSQGHSLMNYDPAKNIQLRFMDLAKRYLSVLKTILLHSKYPKERMIAAYVIAYYPKKENVIPILIESSKDPNEQVRNNAIRSLSAMANSSQLKIDFSKYDLTNMVTMLNSNKWTDKNKSSLFLSAAYNNNNRILSEQLRKKSLPSLKEMALWRNTGHAFPASLILGKLAGWNDQQIFNSLSESRSAMIDKMLRDIR